MENFDVLFDIPFKDLPELANMYENHQDWAPHAYSSILTGIKWIQRDKENNKNQNRVKFMSPNNCWRKDGTFFLIMEIVGYPIFLYSLEKTGKNLYLGLLKTTRIPFEKNPYLYVHDCFLEKISKAISERHLISTVPEYVYHVYCIPKQVALNFKIDIPHEVYIKPLEESMSSYMNEVWPHKSPGSEESLRVLIEMNGSYGVFLKENNKLIAWCQISTMGQLCTLQVLEEYKRKGYGSLITKYTAKKIAEAGFHPLGTILDGNEISLKMFDKMGFKVISTCKYLYLTTTEISL